MKLLLDVVSNFKGRVYARSGDEFEIINDRDYLPQIIIEVKGERFSITTEFFKKSNEVLINPEIQPIVSDTTIQNKPIIHRVPVSKKKTEPINQPSLF